jgi:hypothetical protein
MDFYTYCYLDENLKPYYVGKGRLGRIDHPHHGCLVTLPPKERRLLLKENLTEEEAFKHEVYMIAVLGGKDLGKGPLLNRTDGGEGTSGWEMSETTKAKISLSKLGKERPDIRGDANPMKKPEVAAKLAQAKKGRPCSDGTKQKIRNSLTGRVTPETTRLKQSQALTGKPKTKQHSENIRRAKVGGMYFVNKEGEVIVRREHPGEGWQRGMKWKSTGG